VNSVANDAITFLSEETTRTDAYTEDTPSVKAAVDDLGVELSPDLIDPELLNEALYKSSVRAEARERTYAQTVRTRRYDRFLYQVPAYIGLGNCRDCAQTDDTRECWVLFERNGIETVPVAIYTPGSSVPERTSPQRCCSSV
jgi:hypothetical protein